MKILVTGASGFVGTNLVIRLKSLGHKVMEIDKGFSESDIQDAINEADFIYHLAGVNRPSGDEKFSDNVSITDLLINILKQKRKCTPILITSSIQAELDNEYGKSKLEAEKVLFKFQKDTGNPVYVFRCPNLFGKWARPNYNSVVATFCYNVAHDIEITVNKDAPKIPFLYIDDLIDQMISYLGHAECIDEPIKDLSPIYYATPSEVAELIHSFKESRKSRFITKQEGFAKKLYATYLSYLDSHDFKYDLEMHEDNRGSFTELYKTTDGGQTSINIIHPGITKGNHFHNSKNEKFIVVAGTCEIKFRKINSSEVISYLVSGNKIEVVDIPTGYTHNITNIGKQDAVVVMWASEPFDENRPDTYFEEV